MIYVLDLDQNTKPDIFIFEGLLSEERKLKMERYRLEKDKYLCLLSYLLLRYGLYIEYQKLDLPEFDWEKKPRIKESEICFNISHCDNAVACVIDTEEVGIDIQDYNETVFDVRSMYLTKQEELIVDRNNFSNEELTRIWTMKEAYGKFYGYGLCYSLCETSFNNVSNSDSWQSYCSLRMFSKKYDCYAMSVCSKKELPIKFVNMREIIAFAKTLMKMTLDADVILPSDKC